MKNLIFSSLAILIFGITTTAQDLSPYIKVGESSKSIQVISNEVKSALQNNSFEILGEYNPANKSTLKVIVFKPSIP